MVRTQIRLTVQQYDRLRRWAQQRGISLAEAIRRCVDEKLAAEDAVAEDTAVADALAVCGKYMDPAGPSRVAEEHDRYLAGAPNP